MASILTLSWISCVSKGALLHFEVVRDLVQRNVILFSEHFFIFPKLRLVSQRHIFEEICQCYLLTIVKIINIRPGLKGNACKVGALAKINGG